MSFKMIVNDHFQPQAKAIDIDRFGSTLRELNKGETNG